MNDPITGYELWRLEAPTGRVIGHDYASKTEEIRALLEAGGIRRIRTGKDVNESLASAALAREFNVPLVFGNCLFEAGVHAACAFPNVDRLEFSDLGWNDLIREPVRFENGYGIAPDGPGHGLDPKLAMLREWSKPHE